MLTSFPLLLIGYFKPIPVILLWVALSVAVVPYVWRRVPSVTGSADWGTARDGQAKPTPRWVLWSLVGVAAAFALFQGLFHSQFIIIEYDAASYVQFANWISSHGTTFIPQHAQFFGGHPPSITFNSAAYYQVGNRIVMQFMAGLPMVLSLGFWAGGIRLALFWAPVLGALAVFMFGGLVARLVGPRWAPFGALALGITIPMVYTSRDTYSEPLALILLLGGLSLWIDSQRTHRDPEDAATWRSAWRSHSRSASHVLAGVSGLLFGLIFLVRLDGPSDILFIVPYCGLLVLRRYRQALPLMVGLAVGTLYGAVDGGVLSLPYLDTNKQSVEGLAALIIMSIVGTIVAVWWLRRRGSELRTAKPWVVKAMTMLPVLVLAFFFVRPYAERLLAGANWTARQAAPTLTLHWIYWYTGVATIAFATIAYTMLARRSVKGEEPAWVLPLLVFSWATFVFMLRPAITPHQPYASRRLVPVVLPSLILLAVWLSSWISKWSQVIWLVNVPTYLKRSGRRIVTVACAAVIFLPPLAGLTGLGASKSTGLAFKRTFVGEIAIMNKLCASIPAGVSVLVIDDKMYQPLGGAILNMCHVPVAGVVTTPPEIGYNVTPADIRAAVKAIEDSGHTPFVLAANQHELSVLGKGTVKYILDQDVQDDQHIYYGTPRYTATTKFSIYSWEPAK